MPTNLAHPTLTALLDDDVPGTATGTSLVCTLRINSLPMHLQLIEMRNSPSGWPAPVDDAHSSYVEGLYTAWGTYRPPELLTWQGQTWLVTAEPFER